MMTLYYFIGWCLVISNLPLKGLATGLLRSDYSTCFNDNQKVVYYCTVMGNDRIGATIWSGSVFHCPDSNSLVSNRIYLPHLYNESMGSCNDNIFGHISRINGSLYTSALTITVSHQDNDQNIACYFSRDLEQIFMEVIKVGVVPEPPTSTSIHFSVPSQVFSVSWSKPLNVTGGVGNYSTTTSGDCGVCSNIGIVGVDTMEVSCSGWVPFGQTCNISIFTITADCQFKSVDFASAFVYLKLPTAPEIHNILPTYYLNRSLESIATVLSQDENLRIDENGFPAQYSVTYTHSSSGAEVVLNCTIGVSCVHTFTDDQVQSEGNYSIGLGAQTPVGKIARPGAVFVEAVNLFVNVTVNVQESYTLINCRFLKKQEHITCDVKYDTDVTCSHLTDSKGVTGVNVSDVSLVLYDISPVMSYCFIVAASNGSNLVQVKGSFRGYSLFDTDDSTFPVSTMILSGIVVAMGLMSVVLTSVIVVLCYKKATAQKENATGVYYSSVLRPSRPSEQMTPVDPMYEEISGSKTFDMGTNEAYHRVRPNNRNH